jgi:LuxR family maltose regulon positive regulatory protein
VWRARLIKKLQHRAQSRLTVISAPAGYGKSALLGQWAATNGDAPVAVARFSTSDDPAAATRRLVRALARTCNGAVEEGQGLGGASLESAWRWLPAQRNLVFVVDGADAPGTEFADAVVVPFLRAAPPTVRTVLARRSTPPAVGWTDAVSALNERDLAFTPEEAALLLAVMSGHTLTDAQVQALMDHTQGWAAGLALAAVGLRGVEDVDGYIATFSGRSHHVGAFFDREVLSREDPSARRFLLRTSPLGPMSGPLCDEVTGASGSAAMLKGLSRRGAFTSHLPGSAGRYAYHPMFREFLWHALTLADPGADRETLVRAASWYSARHQLEPAARCLVDGQAWDELLHLALRWGPTMMEDGRGPVVLAWLDAIPGRADDEDVELALLRAAVRTAVGALDRAAETVHTIEALPLSPRQRLVVDVLRATWAFLGPPSEPVLRTITSVRDALQGAPADVRPDVLGLATAQDLAAMAVVVGGALSSLTGDLTHARLTVAPLTRKRGLSLAVRMRSSSSLALAEAWAGNLVVAAAHADRAIELSAAAGLEGHPGATEALLAAAHVHRERGELDASAAVLRRIHRRMVRQGLHPPNPLYAVEQALWHLAADEPEQGLATLERLRDAGVVATPWVLACLRAAEVQLLLAVGRTDRAEALVREPYRGPRNARLRAAGAQAAMARHDLLEATTRLKAWTTDEPEAEERLLRQLWAAVVEFEAGRRRPALLHAAEVVALAERNGHVRLFLDGGPPVERLLHALVHVQPSAFARNILESSRSTARVPGGPGLGLSRRELEVIRYLPTPLSSSEIGARLFISLNTVKSHLQAIYAKLGVGSRKEAIEQAQHLGLA